MLAFIPSYSLWLIAGAVAGLPLWWFIDRYMRRSHEPTRTIAELGAMTASSNDGLAIQGKERGEANRQIADLTRRLEQFERQAMADADEIAKLKCERDELADKLKEASTNASKDIGDLKKRLDQYSAAYSAVEADRDALRALHAPQAGSLESGSTAEADHSGSIATLREEVDKLRVQAALDANTASARLSQIAQLQAQLKQAHNQVAEVQARLDKLSERADV